MRRRFKNKRMEEQYTETDFLKDLAQEVLKGTTTTVDVEDILYGRYSSDAEAEKEEWDIDDIHWVGYSLDEGYYTVLTNVAGGYVMIDLQFGTMEELEMLIKGLEYAE